MFVGNKAAAVRHKPGAGPTTTTTKGNLMPVYPADRPATAGAARSRGMKRLSAVTAGVGVAGVLATGAIAFTLPGASHSGTSATTATSSGSTSSTAAHATSGSSTAATSSTSAATGAKSSVSTSSPGSSDRTDATSGGS